MPDFATNGIIEIQFQYLQELRELGGVPDFSVPTVAKLQYVVVLDFAITASIATIYVYIYIYIWPGLGPNLGLISFSQLWPLSKLFSNRILAIIAMYGVPDFATIGIDIR